MGPEERGRGRLPGVRVPGSLPDRIGRFFDSNPDEELTYEDIMAKFGVTRRLAHSTVNLMTRKGALKTATLIRRGRP